MNLRHYLGNQALGVLAFYRDDRIAIHICGVYPQWDNRLRVFFPKGHALEVGDHATLHLDNRTGVDQLDAELRVYRGSYKGRVISVDEDWALLEPRECLLIHGMKIVVEVREEGYRYPDDPREPRVMLPSPLVALPRIERQEHDNKVGVLITMAREQPHTTVMAFLSSEEEDVFFITTPETFKSQVMDREPHCYFVIDERASFTFDRAIEWNYTIVEGRATVIVPDSPLFEEVRQAFINKNPWEIAFFVRPDLVMYHIPRQRIVYPGEFSDISENN